MRITFLRPSHAVPICLAVILCDSSGLAREMHILLQSGDTVDGATITGFESESSGPVVNDQRNVVFVADTKEGLALMTTDRVILLSDTVTDEDVAVKVDDEDHAFSINSMGTVASVIDVLDTNGNWQKAVFRDQQLVAGQGDVLSGERVGYVGDRFVAINDSGNVLYEAGNKLKLDDRIVVRSGDAIDNTTITSVGRADVNNAGNIAFEFSAAGASGIAIDDAIVYRIEDMIDGHQPRSVNLVGINDFSQLLYQAVGDNGSELIIDDEVVLQDGDFINGTEIRLGSFASSPNSSGNFVTTILLYDPLDYIRGVVTRDELIWAPGDVIDGKETSRLKLNPSINDFGDVVFAVAFTDGTDGLIISSVPEPSSAVMLLAVLVWPRLFRRHTRPRRNQHAIITWC